MIGPVTFRGPSGRWRHYLIVVLGLCGTVVRSPHLIPFSTWNFQSKSRDSIFPSSVAPWWLDTLNCVSPQDGQGPKKLKELCFLPLESAKPVAHSPERWACAQTSAGHTSYSLHPKNEKPKSLIFHDKEILTSIALNKTVYNLKPMNGHLNRQMVTVKCYLI